MNDDEIDAADRRADELIAELAADTATTEAEAAFEDALARDPELRRDVRIQERCNEANYRCKRDPSSEARAEQARAHAEWERFIGSRIREHRILALRHRMGPRRATSRSTTPLGARAKSTSRAAAASLGADPDPEPESRRRVSSSGGAS